MNPIQSFDELDLQRKIAKFLNQFGYNFEKTSGNFFCDIIEPLLNIFIEVKPDNLAPAQLLYGLAINGIKDVTLLGLANSFELRLYNPPSYGQISDFAKKIDPNFSLSPSQINKKEYNEQAMILLGNHVLIYSFDSVFDIKSKVDILFITHNNYSYFSTILDKYNINPAKFLPYIADMYQKNNQIKINKNGLILELNSGIFYSNLEEKDRGKRQTNFRGEFIPLPGDYRPIRNTYDKALIESTRIRNEDVVGILHKIDQLTPTSIRREKGKYFTDQSVSQIVTEIISSHIDFDILLEPYVGGGSLIEPFINNNLKFIINDISSNHIDLLKRRFDGYNISFHSTDFFTHPIEDILNNWGIESDKRLFIYSNPPFGTKNANRLTMSSDENSISRVIKINYGGLDKLYGKGDLVIPGIGKMIEIIKRNKSGFLGFFSPFGIFCERVRYLKLLNEILRNFEFITGTIFSGKLFHDVKKNKPISFSLWEYKPNVNTQLEDISFFFEGAPIKFQRSLLLKDCWDYDNRKIIIGEIGVQGNDRFNVAAPKIIHDQINKGGSELISENVKRDLKIPNISTQFAIGIWSCTVGYRSLSNYPLYVDNSYVHLPDFAEINVQKILALALLPLIITEIDNNYTNGKIGFSGVNSILHFGGNVLTMNANFLLEFFKDFSITDEWNISDIVDKIKNNKITDSDKRNIKKEVKIKIEELLEIINYFNYIPLPLKKSSKKMDLIEFS
jgi:hypothetical protein